MKILHVGKYFIPHYGGIETFMSQLMAEQLSQGLEVAALVHANRQQYRSKEYSWNGCRIFEVCSYGQLIFAPIAPSFPWKLSRCIKAFKPDIIHVHMPNPSAFWLLLFSIKNIKIVIHWHSDVLGAAPTTAVKMLYPCYRVLERMLLKKSTKVIATSPNYLNSSEPLSGYLHKSVAIPLGIQLRPCRPEKFSHDSVLKLVMIGRLTYYKNHELVISTIERLLKSNRSVDLNIIGTGELLGRLSSLIERDERVKNHVRLLGSVDEQTKQSILAEADMLLLPSSERTEAFGVVLLEAANFSKPVLVSDVEGSGMNYVVTDKKNGFVVKANDAGHLYEVLDYATKNKHELCAMGQRHYDRLVDNFDIKVISQLVSSLYSESLNQLN